MKKLKSPYNVPELEIIAFGTEDIVTSSGNNSWMGETGSDSNGWT